MAKPCATVRSAKFQSEPQANGLTSLRLFTTISFRYCRPCSFWQLVKKAFDLLWPRNPIFDNVIEHAEKILRDFRRITQIDLAGMDCVIANNPTKIERLLNLDGQTFSH